MNINFIFCMILIFLGLYCMVSQKNLIKMIMGLAIMDNGLNLLLVSVGYKDSGSAPILDNPAENLLAVNPIPQALTLTSIVIGICIVALALGIIVKIHEHYGSLNSDDLRRLKG